MNDIEIIQSKDGIEDLIAGLKPATAITWNTETHSYEIDTSAEVVERNKTCCEIVKSALREVWKFGQTVYRGTAKFCLMLRLISLNLLGVEDSDTEDGYSYHKSLGIRPAMGAYNSSDQCFKNLVCKIGISDTAAYRYRDLGIIVDEKTQEFYPEFNGYSLSLLDEMRAYLRWRNYSLDKYDFIALTKVVPPTTTVDDMRTYYKIMKLHYQSKTPFEDYKIRNKITTATPLADVLEIYNGLLQEQESNRLLDLVKATEKTETVNPAELVGNELLINNLKKEIEVLKRTSVPNLGKCDGCIYKNINLNKCRCCRRYSNLKDLFKSE